MESTAAPPGGNNPDRWKSDKQDRLAQIAGGITKNGVWTAEIVRNFMCDRIYEFFNEHKISKEELETF